MVICCVKWSKSIQCWWRGEQKNFNSWFSISLFSVACSATKTICCQNMGKYHYFRTFNTLAAEEEKKHSWPVFIHTYFVIMKTTASAGAIGKYYMPMSYSYGSFPWILKHRQNSWNYVINWITYIVCMYVCYGYPTYQRWCGQMKMCHCSHHCMSLCECVLIVFSERYSC